MVEVIVENLVEIMAALLIALIGVAGAYLTKKIGTKKELVNVEAAKEEAFKAAIDTVRELKQLFVDGYKEANEDGKLTPDEIRFLNKELVERAMAKLGEPAKKVLEAARIDAVNYIASCAESWISNGK